MSVTQNLFKGNPKYHGRPSFKEKVRIISGSKKLVDITLEEGSHHSNHSFLDFFKGCESSLPNRWILKMIRCDRGFFDSITSLTSRIRVMNMSSKPR